MVEKETATLKINKAALELINSFATLTDEDIPAAFAQLRDIGDSTIMIPFLEMYKTSTNTVFISNANEFLKDLKNKESIKSIIVAIQDPLFSHRLFDLISVCWQLNYDFSPFVDVFISVFLNSDFALAFEAYTVIEQCIPELSANDREKQTAILKANLSELQGEKLALCKALIANMIE